ncbi:MAG: hypothetical protein ACRD3W_22705, partial [Terriglobales bacterium]
MSDELSPELNAEQEEVNYFHPVSQRNPAASMQAYLPWRVRPAAIFFFFVFIIGIEFGIVGMCGLLGRGPLGLIPVAGVLIGLVAFAAYRRSGRFLLTQSGIQFPNYFSFGLRGNVVRQWSELKSIDVDMDSHVRRNSVGLEFNDGAKVKIYLWRLPPEDANAFRNGLIKWCPLKNARLADIPAISEYEREHSFDFGLAQNPVITKNFAFTSYSRLQPGSELNGYTIEAPLAGGNYSCSYVARSSAGTKVLLREMRLTDECDEKEVLKNRLMIAAEQLGVLAHPGLAKVFDAFC